MSRHPLSLEMPIDDEGDGELGDFIEDENSPAPDEEVSSSVLRALLREMLQDLPPRAVRILQLRYGLVDGETYTLEEVIIIPTILAIALLGFVVAHAGLTGLILWSRAIPTVIITIILLSILVYSYLNARD